MRAPDHPLTLELLRQFDGPVAGPSANRSNRVSPTTAEHVRKELGSRVDLILDGGPCRVGIESTVLDLSGQRPRILRPGGISHQQIEEIVGPVEVFAGTVDASTPAASPGQQRVHYSPTAPTYRFERAQRMAVDRWCDAHRDEPTVVLVVGTMTHDDALRDSLGPRHQLIEMPDNAGEYARQLYAVLHEADARHVAAIWIEMPPNEPPWTAVADRLRRATRAPAT